MKQLLVHFATQRPKQIMWLTLVLTLMGAALIPLIQIDTDPENMLPHDQADRVAHNRIKQDFNLYDLLVVGLVSDHQQGIYNDQSLQNLKQLSQDIKAIDGVIEHELMSLASVDNITQAGPGTIRFQWMMPEDPKAQLSPEQIQQAVKRLPLFENTLVSADGKAAAIYVPIEQKDQSHRISIAIQAYIDELPGDDQYHITGLPVAEDTFGIEMFIQMAISAPLAALAIFGLMWVFFRNVPLITAPMLVAMATVIITMGCLIGAGFTVHIMSSMIPIFLMPIAVVDSVHILSEFAETHKPGDKVEDSVETVISNLFRPMLFTSITSAVGFASLAFTPIPPVQVFGVFVAFGIALAFLFTITFVPAYIVNLSPAKISALAQRHHSNQGGPIAGFLHLCQRLSTGASKLVIAVAVGLGLFSFYGTQQIEINDNPVRWFHDDHRIRVADRVLNEHFAGTYDAYLVLEKDVSEQQEKFLTQLTSFTAGKPELQTLVKQSGFNDQPFATALTQLINNVDDALFGDTDAVAELEQIMSLAEQAQSSAKYFLQPQALAYLEKLQQYLAQQGKVGKSNSFADLTKTVFRELNGGGETFYRLPENANQTAQTVLSYQSSHRPYDLWHFVTPEYTSTAIWLQLTSGDNKDMSAVLQQVEQFVANNPLPAGVSLEWGGLTYINLVWQEEMVAGMLDSLLGAFVVVFLVMVLLFRSLIYGILAMIPLSLTIAIIYGLIGWIGKDYDMPVAVLSSLTLGLSVDFAIHFLDRARAIQQDTGSWTKTLSLMFEEPGLAIARNAIVIAIGFTPLLAAPLVPYNTVGIFLASIMAASAIVTLLLLPSLMTTVQNWIFKNNQRSAS